jgi:hypothetical protein
MPSPALILAHTPDQVSADARARHSTGTVRTTEQFTLHSGSTRTDYTEAGCDAGGKQCICAGQAASFGASAPVM